MARGQVFTLPTNTATLIETTSHEEMQSAAVLNPNDGVVYLKLNGPAGPTPSQWDWKLPSQSYGLFPGPWISLGIYYSDQSGSGRSAELNVYDSSDKLYTPYIVAIGRAVQLAGTTLDISQGLQPQNPPAGTSRIWVDTLGNAYLLSSDGTNVHLMDTNDALGGVLKGTLPNPAHADTYHQFGGTIRSYTQTDPPNTGPGSIGIELFGQPPNNRSVVQSIDRSPAGAGALSDLLLYGKKTSVWGGNACEIQSFAGNVQLIANGGIVIPGLSYYQARLNDITVAGQAFGDVGQVTCPDGLYLISGYTQTRISSGSAEGGYQLQLCQLNNSSIAYSNVMLTGTQNWTGTCLIAVYPAGGTGGFKMRAYNYNAAGINIMSQGTYGLLTAIRIG